MRRTRWRVAAWITLATSMAQLAVMVLFAIDIHEEALFRPPQLDDGLAYWGLTVILAVPAACLAAVAFLALVSILSRQRSVMIAATVLGVLVNLPIMYGIGWLTWPISTARY
jgi:hypothetical protein